MTRISRSGGAGSPGASAFARSAHRAVEALEERVLLSTFIVTNTADSGPGSLRQAILSANAALGIDTITFNIPGPGLHTIAPLSPLPVISDVVTIDGTTQFGYSTATGVPVIELNGSKAGSGANGLVLGATTQGPSQATESVVKGLIINRFAGDGIVIQGARDQVKGCYIGTNADGSAAAPNGGNGITVVGGGALIGGSTTADRNVISGNALAGIDALAIPVITGNYIGTNAIGTAAVGNGHEGIHVESGATIGGAGPLRNVISGNGYSGIESVALGYFVQILGNYIGTDATGSAGIGNGVSPAAPYCDGITITGNAQIGAAPAGTTPAIGNVISANKGAGIAVGNANDQRVAIASNLIGTDATGAAALGNVGDGIRAGWFVTIGAANSSMTSGSIVAGGGNVISGNGGDGILIQAQARNGGQIQGNYIGTNLSGTAAIPNAANGIELQGYGVSVGQDLGAGNVISGNRGNGILIDNAVGSLSVAGQNRVVNNLIGTDASGNAALGNAGNGILIVGSGNNTIATLGQKRQVISGNGAAGIASREPFIQGQSGGNNTISGNYIGTNLAGNAPLGNGSNGIEDFSIGDVLASNLISGNGASGVYLGAPATTVTQDIGVTLIANDIGTNAAGAVAAGFGNVGDGITIYRSSNNTVSGSGSFRSNIIAGNGGNGVTVDSGGIVIPGGNQSTTAVRNRISQNSIYSNGGLGIDLGNDGVTPNSPPPQVPAGPNLLEGFPVIISAILEPGYTYTRYQLSSAAATVEFFSNNVADPSGYGEGQTFLRSFPGGAAGAVLVANLPLLPVGTLITATATDSVGNTSEFAQDVAVIAPPPTATHPVFDPQNNTLSFSFSTDVSASLSTSALRVHNQTTGMDFPATSVSYNPSNNTATFQLPGTLPSGTYVATLLARDVTNSAGVHLDGNGDGTPGDDFSFTFNVVSGDVNLDGAVSFDDLLIVARDYGQQGVFSQGDLNHDGRVDFADLLILAQGYGQGAASPTVQPLR